MKVATGGGDEFVVECEVVMRPLKCFGLATGTEASASIAPIEKCTMARLLLQYRSDQCAL